MRLLNPLLELHRPLLHAMIFLLDGPSQRQLLVHSRLACSFSPDSPTPSSSPSSLQLPGKPSLSCSILCCPAGHVISRVTLFVLRYLPCDALLFACLFECCAHFLIRCVLLLTTLLRCSAVGLCTLMHVGCCVRAIYLLHTLAASAICASSS